LFREAETAAGDILLFALTPSILLQCIVRADLHGFVSEYESAFAMIPALKSIAKSHAHLSDAVQLQVSACQLSFFNVGTYF